MGTVLLTIPNEVYRLTKAESAFRGLKDVIAESRYQPILR